MAHVSITLKAGVPKRQNFGAARFLTLSDLGAAASVDVEVEANGFSRESVRGMRARDRLALMEGAFDGVTFTAAVDCTVEVFASMLDLRLNNADGAAVNAQIVGTVPVSVLSPDPLPVQNEQGDAPGNPLYVAGVLAEDAPANTITDRAAVAAGPAAAVLLAADATRLEFVAYNIGPNPVAIGMAGITWAKRAIVINAGDTWIERRGAHKAWEMITDAGMAGSVTVQERKS